MMVATNFSVISGVRSNMTQAENTQYFLSQPAQVRQDKTIAKHSSEEGKWEVPSNITVINQNLKCLKMRDKMGVCLQIIMSKNTVTMTMLLASGDENCNVMRTV